MRLASDSIEPLPHAKICNHWHTISSMVSLPLKTNHLPQPLQAFLHFQEELSITDSILLKATRAIVPSSLHPSMLTKIHHSHRGPEYCLHFARDAIFWPNMSKDIEEFCHTCPTCAQYGKQAVTELMLSHSNTSVAIRLQGHIYVQPQTVFNHSGSLQWLLRVGQTSRHPINHCHQSYKSPFRMPRHPSTLPYRQRSNLCLMNTSSSPRPLALST